MNSASIFKDISCFKEILLIARKQKGHEIFKEKSRKFSDV